MSFSPFSGFSSSSKSDTSIISYDGSFNTELIRTINFGDIGGISLNVGAPNEAAKPIAPGFLAAVREWWPLDATSTAVLAALLILAALWRRRT